MSKTKILIAIIGSIFALAVLGYLLTMSVGKPISSDLSVIGQGKPTLVLAYQNYSPPGGEALNRLRKVQDDYDERMEFVVADLGTQEGVAFANQYQLIDGLAIMLTKQGGIVQVTGIPPEEDKLRSFLDARLAELE